MQRRVEAWQSDVCLLLRVGSLEGQYQCLEHDASDYQEPAEVAEEGGRIGEFWLFEDNTPSGEEAESEASGEAPLISLAEVAEVVKQLFICMALGVDEIHPEMLKALDMVGLAWLTRLANVACGSGTVPVVWQTRVVVPIFKKGDRRVCTNHRGSHCSASQGVCLSSLHVLCGLGEGLLPCPPGNSVGGYCVWGTGAVGTCHSVLVQTN